MRFLSVALAALIGQMLPMAPETGRTNTPSARVPIWIAVLALLLLIAGWVGLPLLALPPIIVWLVLMRIAPRWAVAAAVVVAD